MPVRPGADPHSSANDWMTMLPWLHYPLWLRRFKLQPAGCLLALLALSSEPALQGLRLMFPCASSMVICPHPLMVMAHPTVPRGLPHVVIPASIPVSRAVVGIVRRRSVRLGGNGQGSGADDPYLPQSI